MTGFYSLDKKCKICDATSKQYWFHPCLKYYKPDLDLRYSEYDKRLALQVCPE